MVLALLGLAATAARAQSQAVNGTIEGTIKDASGGLLPGVTVTVHNTDTGAERVVVTDANGLFRAPLLPLGTYQVTAELSGFKKSQQTGIPITAGSSAVINIALEVGGVSEVVSVQADAAVVDLGKVDVGRNLNDREIHNLPMVSRNPYNFALLQPGVSGSENSEFGVPRFSANGSLLRINYQMDGNTNTQKDRAGLRLMPMSEVAIGEVKVTTSGYAPEFGQTMGLVYNAITPSGTNKLRGDVSYRFRRTPFSAYPFFSTINPRSSENKPADVVNTVTASSRRPGRAGQDPLLRRIRAHLSRPDRHLQPGSGAGRGGRAAAAAQHRAGLPERPLLPREGRLPARAGAPADHARQLVREQQPVQRRRRQHHDDRARLRLQGRDELDRRAARVELGIEPPERAAHAVRAAAFSPPDARRARRHLGRRSPTPSPSAIRPRTARISCRASARCSTTSP